MKNLLDPIIALFILILLSPILLLLAIAIKIDSQGPVFYLQTRVGKNGKEFKIFKFRSMYINDGINLTAGKNDLRITRVGYWIRRLHLDEFAQTINVLKCEMSLVGPRPETPDFVIYFPDMWKQILTFKPGITGLAAIKCADYEYKLLGESSDPKRIYISKILPRKLKYDLFYVQKQSFMFDCLIIFKTICLMIGKN